MTHPPSFPHNLHTLKTHHPNAQSSHPPQSKPRQLCFFAFLPDILDTGAKGRNGYITILKDLAKK